MKANGVSNSVNCGKPQNCSCDKTDKKCNQNSSKINLTPAQALVIGGILTGVLDVFSFLIDVHQHIEITLIGDIKPDAPQKTDLNGILDTLGSMPLDDILSAVIEHLSK